MDSPMLLVCFDINSSHEENQAKNKDKTKEELPETPTRIFTEYFDNHKNLKVEKSQLNPSEIKYNFNLTLPESSPFNLILINDLSFIHDICLNADGYLIIINLEDIKTEEKLEYIIKYISESCCTMETKAYIVGLYKDKILPGCGKEELENLFNEHNFIFEYYQIKLSSDEKKHFCFFDLMNNKANNRKNVTKSDGNKLQEILERIIINMYELKMNVEFDYEKKRFVQSTEKGNEAISKCNIY